MFKKIFFPYRKKDQKTLLIENVERKMSLGEKTNKLASEM